MPGIFFRRYLKDNMYENYVFDLYGTLVDIHTEEDLPAVWEKMALFYGYYGVLYNPEALRKRYQELIRQEETADPACPRYAHESFPEIQIEKIFHRLYLEKGYSADDPLVLHTAQFFRTLTTEYIRLYEGAIPLLRSLRQAGKKVYLLSNAQRVFTQYELKLLGIDRFFDRILISSDYGVKKPDIQFFHILLEQEHLSPSRTLMIGNDPVCDIAGAKNAGMDTFYIHSNLSPDISSLPKATYVLEQMDLIEAKQLLIERNT